MKKYKLRQSTVMAERFNPEAQDQVKRFCTERLPGSLTGLSTWRIVYGGSVRVAVYGDWLVIDTKTNRLDVLGDRRFNQLYERTQP